MSASPLVIIVVFAVSMYIARLWLVDYRLALSGKPNPKALPGATGAPARLLWIGIAGALLLVAIETIGEISLGISAEQSDIAGIALLSLIAAGIIEEIIFRGYLVVQNRGKAWLIVSIIGFSLLFSLLHYQYYVDIDRTSEATTINVEIGLKEGWTLLLLFLNAIWFYCLRFLTWNPQKSLLPCFAAHIASNLAVFAVKLMQGHVTGLW